MLTDKIEDLDEVLRRPNSSDATLRITPLPESSPR
jgi:hypothetical protein